MKRTILGGVVPLAVLAMVTVGAVSPASALSTSTAGTLPPFGDTVTAPTEDGTSGANDGSPVVNLPATTSFAAVSADSEMMTPFGVIICDPYSSWYVVNSPQKSGAVTTWSKHIKNDATPETFTWSSTNAVTLTASTSISGSLSAGVALEKIANAALGITSNFGTSGQVASTASYSRSVTFSSAGSWIIWAGVYKGTGSVQMKQCSSNGQTSSTVGSGSGVTFNKGRVTGLTNCANSVTDLVELNAKTRC